MISPIEIARYNPDWPGMYETEKSKIDGVIGEQIEAIEHVGSTSVPGLGAKPIIDIMAAIPGINEAESLIAPLKAIGYEYLPEYEQFIPERRFFRKYGQEPAHLHIVERTTAFWMDHLLFRDFLRVHPKAASRYESMKRKLAAKIVDDRLAFTEGKTEFINDLLAQARRWRDGDGREYQAAS